MTIWGSACATLWGVVFRPIWSEKGCTFCLISLKLGISFDSGVKRGIENWIFGSEMASEFY